MAQDYEIRGEAVRFWVKVKPRARRQRLIRGANGEISFETPAPPVDGKANAAVVDYLARGLRVPRNTIEIVLGAKTRRKLVEIGGLPGTEICKRFESLLSRAE